MPVESSIWRAYVLAARVDGTLHTYEVPVKPPAIDMLELCRFY